MTNALSTLVITIERHHKEVQTHSKKTGAAVHACGLALIEAKRQVGPGKWIAWVKDNLSFGDKQASNYMKIGRLDPKRISDLDSMTEALEEAKRETWTEDYLKKRQDKIRVEGFKERVSSSIITDEDIQEEQRQHTKAKDYAVQTDLMLKLVKAGYRALAAASHPDTGGSHEAMVQLTEAKDQLVKLIEEQRTSQVVRKRAA